MVNATQRPKINIIGNRRVGKTALAAMLGSGYDCREMTSIPAAIAVGSVTILIFGLESTLNESDLVFDRLRLITNKDRVIVYVCGCETVVQRTAAFTVLQEIDAALILGTSDPSNRVVYNDTKDALVCTIRDLTCE